MKSYLEELKKIERNVDGISIVADSYDADYDWAFLYSIGLYSLATSERMESLLEKMRDENKEGNKACIDKLHCVGNLIFGIYQIATAHTPSSDDSWALLEAIRVTAPDIQKNLSTLIKEMEKEHEVPF